MDTVKCSNCGFENAAGLSFCTNCGNSLQQSSSLPPTYLNQPPPTMTGNMQPPPAKKGGAGKKLAVFGGLGCLALTIGGIALLTLLAYIGGTANSNVAQDTGNTRSNANVVVQNRGAANNSGANTNARTNANSGANTNSTDDPDTKQDAIENIDNFFPEQIGQYQQQGETAQGNPTDDFPGADKIVKSSYAKKLKAADVVLAQFSSPASAKSSYGYFLQGFKNIGANVLKTEKIKNKNGIETGEIAFYAYKPKGSSKTIYETMFYADKYGFRITSNDLQTLGEFVQEFGEYVEMIGG